VLAYNESSSKSKKQLRTSNIGLGKSTCVKINMKLNYNSV